jgi:hypothetical protein
VLAKEVAGPLTLMESQPELERCQALCGDEVFRVETWLPTLHSSLVATASV